MNKKTKRIMTGIICTAVAGVLIAAGLILYSRFSVPKNPNGSGYDTTAVALEDAKMHAKLKGSEYQNSMRMPDMDSYSKYYFQSKFQQIAYTGDGFYTIGSPSKDHERNGICYTDAESGQTVYLCAKPECLHDGSDFCAATNANYDVLQIVWYEGALYAVANKDTGDAEHPTAFVLLKYEPDGTGMYELATLDSRGEAQYPELIAHRGALWVTATTVTLIDISDPALGIEDAYYVTQYYAVWHYEIAKSRLTLLAGGVSNGTHSFSNLQASGDHVYVYKLGSVPDEQVNPMGIGLYQIDAQTGRMQCLSQSPLKNYYIADTESLFWITKAKEASTETKEIYVLHSLSDGSEREVEIPRGEVYFYDGQYLLIGSDDCELLICDLDGNILRTQRFAQEEREYDYAPDRHCFAGADGMLYHIRTEYYGVGSVERITEMQSVPIEGFLSGAEDFTTVFSIYHCWFIP